jgi:hypothetical protein
MIALVHCWWCGKLAEVDTGAETSGGMIRDSEASWICDGPASEECSARAVGLPRNQRHDHSACRLDADVT